MEQVLEVAEFKSLAKLVGITKVSPGLKINQNGYPYVTLYRKDGKATNVYFSRASAQSVIDTIGEGNSVKNYILSTSIAKTVNEGGETRYKFTSPNNRESLFEDDNDVTNFNVEEFVKQFESQAVTA